MSNKTPDRSYGVVPRIGQLSSSVPGYVFAASGRWVNLAQFRTVSVDFRPAEDGTYFVVAGYPHDSPVGSVAISCNYEEKADATAAMNRIMTAIR